jgi:hypothetical protein
MHEKSDDTSESCPQNGRPASFEEVGYRRPWNLPQASRLIWKYELAMGLRATRIADSLHHLANFLGTRPTDRF